MMITKSHKRRIKVALEQGSLQANEVRRVEGLGGQFVMLATGKIPAGYVETLSFTFENVDYKILAKIGDER